jgi:hypothetical protein
MMHSGDEWETDVISVDAPTDGWSSMRKVGKAIPPTLFIFEIIFKISSYSINNATKQLIGQCQSSTGTTIPSRTFSPTGSYEPVKFITHSVPYKHLMQDSQFVNACTFGNRDVIASGVIKNYLGVEINESPKGTLVVGGGTYRSLLLSKGALAGALKRGITVETEYSPRQRRRWVIASMRWGAVCLHNDGIFWVLSVET